MTARPFPESGQDQTYWRPPVTVVNPQSLPPSHHALVWVSGRAGSSPAWHCAAYPFETRDPGDAAGHKTHNQFTVGSRPEPVVIDPPRGNADERGDDR
jgi:hypothetical protein